MLVAYRLVDSVYLRRYADPHDWVSTRNGRYVKRWGTGARMMLK
jgi:hypothetical protein